LFRGRVHAVTPKGDPVARSYRVRIELDEDTPLLIGMTAETNIIVAHRENALLVPASAVVDGKVWVVENGRLAERKVAVGSKSADLIEIAGIGLDDLIVAKPRPSLVTGTKVRIKVASEARP
jgi:multidrug efflux pump subunit AcrA (membrane-fusion protein)